jgi:NADH-quinone oxidoreductase subunit H
VYGIVLAGWSSNNKYALLGGLRSSAQMISYEIAMGMSLIPVLLIAGNVTLTSIVRQQATMGWNVILLSVSFFVFLVAAFAETNRLPFDLPEAESELIAGYHTEYSGMKFSMFMIGEYANMLTASALISTIFFGGWDIPFTTWDNVAPFSKLKTILTLGAMITKVLFFCFFYIWIRWTLPRFRYDQLMSLGWKFMLPLALTYIVVVASATLAFDALGLQRGSYAYLGALGALNLTLLIALFVGLDRGRLISPAYGRTRRPQLAQLQAVYKRTGAMVPPLAPEPGD